MAVRVINTTDTLEKFRTEFNALAAVDFGDIATLDSSLSATSVIGAVNELSAQVSASLGIFIEDATSTRQQIGAGQTINVIGTSNQVNLTVSATDTLTASLPNDVTIANNLTVTNNLVTNNNATISGQLDAGSVRIAGNVISVTDSTILSFGSENLQTAGNITGGTINATSVVSSGPISGTTITGTGAITGTALNINENIVFEGSSDDANETTLTATNPTQDNTLTLPDITGTLITTGDTGTVTSTMILNGTISNEDIADSTIRAAKLDLSSDTLTVDTLSANTITGTASVAQLVEITANNTANETVFLTFVDGSTGNQGLESDTNLTYNPSTNILSTTTTAAQYADLAEKYLTDEVYEEGTIVMFGGSQEVTKATNKTNKVAGVISRKPAFLMNNNLTADTSVIVALQGRVMCKVKGKIEKGDMIVSGDNGVGIADNNPSMGTVIGKSLENYDSSDIGVIEVVVGRL